MKLRVHLEVNWEGDLLEEYFKKEKIWS